MSGPSPAAAAAPPGIEVHDRAPRRSIAIIGSGVAGLTATHHLAPHHDVTLFEAADRPGGHVNTVDLEIDGTTHAVDTGFIVFNRLNYPVLYGLFDELGVESQPTSMSFSVRCDVTGLEYDGTSIDRLFAQRRNLASPRFLGMIRDILRFNREAAAVLGGDRPDGRSVEQYVREERYGSTFVEHYLVPMGASLWSCPPGTFRRFPIAFVVEFMRHHVMLSIAGRPEWRTVIGGARTYVRRIVERLGDRFRPSTPIRSIERSAGGTVVRSERYGTETYNHVVIACHSDTALALLADADPVEREVLSAIRYQRNEAVLHTDPSVLPRRRKAWAAWNYHRPLRPDRDDRRRDGRRRRIDADVSEQPVSVTYHMNILQRLATDVPVNVTLNDPGTVDPARVAARIEYHHPVFTPEARIAQGRRDELVDRDGRSFCGAYWGFGFHEDGARSALPVVRALGVEA